MIEQPLLEVIEKLILGTKQNKIKWGKTHRESEFKVILGSSAVTIDNWVLETGVDCVDLTLLNSKGEIAKRIAFENDLVEGNDYKTLLTLYTLVKDSYYQVNDTIAEVLSHLDF